MRRSHTIGATLLIVLAGCSDAESIELFTPEAATAVARTFHEGLQKGDVATLAASSRAPFRYKGNRTWETSADVRLNLEKEVPRIQHLAKGLDRIDVFSRRDLMDGRWPRNREVPEKERKSAVSALGLEDNGWIAWIHSDLKAGYQMVLNADSPLELKVQALDI